MSRRNQRPKLDCWLAPEAEAADEEDKGEERDDEDYDLPDSSLSNTTTTTKSSAPRIPAMLVAGNSCGHNSAFSLLRNRVTTQVQESVSRVKSRLGRVMRRRPRYCSIVCSRRLLLDYRNLHPSASVSSRRTQSADDSTAFSHRSDIRYKNYFDGDGTPSSRSVATASVSIELSIKQPHYQLQQLAHNRQNTSETYTFSGYETKNIQNIQPQIQRSTIGAACGGDTMAPRPRVASGAGKTSHTHCRVYAPECCLLANRFCDSSNAKTSPGAASRPIYLPQDALRSIVQLQLGQKPQLLSHEKMRRVNTSEAIQVAVFAETSEEEVSWPVPLLINSSSAQGSLQHVSGDTSMRRSQAGPNNGGGSDTNGGGGGGGCCGCRGKAKDRQVVKPVLITRSSSSDVKNLESGTVESDGNFKTMSIVIDSNLAMTIPPADDTSLEDKGCPKSKSTDWIFEIEEGAQSAEMPVSTTSTTAKSRRKSQQLPPLPEETTCEPKDAADGTLTQMETITEETTALEGRRPCKCTGTVETLEHPRRQSPDFDARQQKSRPIFEVIQPENAFRQLSPVRAYRAQQTEPAPIPFKPQLLGAPRRVHAQTKSTATKTTNSHSSPWMTQEMEIALVIDDNAGKKLIPTSRPLEDASSDLVLDTETSDSESEIYEVSVITGDSEEFSTHESDSGTVVEEIGADNVSMSSASSDSPKQKSINQRMYQVSQLSSCSDNSIDDVYIDDGCSREKEKPAKQALGMANCSSSTAMFEVSSLSTESDEISIDEVHVGCYKATSQNEQLNRINHSAMSNCRKNAPSSSSNTCSSERADRMPLASFALPKNNSMDAASLNWNATNSHPLAVECLTIRPAVCTRTAAVLTEVNLPVARQTCSLYQVALLPAVNHTHDHGSSCNDPATANQHTVSKVSIGLARVGCNASEHDIERDTHDTVNSSVVFQLASRVDDESSSENTNLSASGDRPLVKFFADEDADWISQQRHICLIQTPALVLQARSVPYDPAREVNRALQRRIHQYLMPTRVAPAESAAFKSTISWLADCNLLSLVQPKGNALLSVAGCRPVFSKVHHVPDISLKLATTTPLQLLRNDTGEMMSLATVRAAVRGLAACQCSTGSVAPMLSTKFTSVETPGKSATASMWRRHNNLNVSNNAEGRSAADKRLLTSWLKDQTAAAAAVTSRPKPLPSISLPLFSPPQFAQIIYSSGESRWLCLSKSSNFQQFQQHSVALEPLEMHSCSKSWEALTGDTNNSNRVDRAVTFRRWGPPCPPSAAAGAFAVTFQAATKTAKESKEVAVVANTAASCSNHSSRKIRRRGGVCPERKAQVLRSSCVQETENSVHLFWWSLAPLASSQR